MAPSPDGGGGGNQPKAKKHRVEKDATKTPAEFVYCQILFCGEAQTVPTTLLASGKTRNDLAKLRTLLDAHGLRTSVIESPRDALSVYVESCLLDDSELYKGGKAFLVTMLGLHPHQCNLEHAYTTFIRNVYCLASFCHRLREACPMALRDEHVAELVSDNEQRCRDILSNGIGTNQLLEDARALSESVPGRVAALIQEVVRASQGNRVEQWQHEFNAITLRNSTLSSAMVTLFHKEHQCNFKEVLFKRSHLSKYERITIYLYDPQIDHSKPPQLLFIPSLRTALRQGPDAIAEQMVTSFWSHLLRLGYFSSSSLKQELCESLHSFFLSGITRDSKAPLQLNAQFEPRKSLSLYIHGKAGSGKSSFVRNFQPALEATIEEHMDPEILVRFVKQNLNKRMDVLELELELRPNNNDLSVMSIIQGRRMTMSQSKPGLVVVDLEEMPSTDRLANPNQLGVARLISQRFSGRSGHYQETGKPPPRNSDRHGIGHDAALVTIFTSNYELEEKSREALERLKMFQGIVALEMMAVSGEDRMQFARKYLQQCVADRVSNLQAQFNIFLDIPVGEGDTRPLVRHLRMLAFYIVALAAEEGEVDHSFEVRVSQHGDRCSVSVGNRSTELKVGALDALFPVTSQVFDARVNQALACLKRSYPGTELSIILNFWLAKTLAPAVILSHDGERIRELVDVLGRLNEVHSIADVDADDYKMMKSLYDPTDMPNLRDDILRFGRGAFVAVEIQCPSKDSQLCIREIVEDSPSMTAFSTAKSALFKEGLLFAICIEGEITPELKSRASMIL